MDKNKLQTLLTEPVDDYVLEHFLALVADEKTLRDVVDREGFTYAAGDLIKPHPAVGQLRETQKQILTFYTRFGLTPRDRQLLTKDEKAAEDFSQFSDLDD